MAEDPIKMAYSQAQEKWPGLEIAFERFKTYLEDKHREANESKKIIKIEKMAAKDLYLAMALSDKDPLAMELFHYKYLNRIKNASIRSIGNNHHVEDIIQQFELEILERIKKYLGIGSLHGWLWWDVQNFAKDYLRKTKHYEPRNFAKDYLRKTKHYDPLKRGSDISDIPSPNPHYEQFDIKECKALFEKILPKAMDVLKDDWRLMIQCKFFDGLTNREIAATVLKTKEYNISKWLKKAFEKMRKRLLNLALETGPDGIENLLDCLELLGISDLKSKQKKQ